jgi:hypothetical protein
MQPDSEIPTLTESVIKEPGHSHRPMRFSLIHVRSQIRAGDGLLAAAGDAELPAQ